MNTFKHKAATGFTLTELIIGVAIMGIAMSIGLPSFQDFIREIRIINAANTMVSTLQLARSESIKRLRPVSIVPKDGSNWQSGWLVFVNESDGSTPVVQNFDALKNINVLDNFQSPEIIYQPSGRVSSFNNGTFNLCLPEDTNGNINRKIFRNVVIAATGRVRIESPKNAQSPC